MQPWRMDVCGMFQEVMLNQSQEDSWELDKYETINNSWHRPIIYFQVGTEQLLEYKGEDKKYPDDAWVAAPVKKGSLVLIHGQVITWVSILSKQYPSGISQIGAQYQWKAKTRLYLSYHWDRGISLCQQELAATNTSESPTKTVFSYQEIIKYFYCIIKNILYCTSEI